MWPSEDDVVDEYVLFQPVVAAVGDPFYKITSEALLVCQQLVIVIRPLGVYLLPVSSMFHEYSLTSYKQVWKQVGNISNLSVRCGLLVTTDYTNKFNLLKRLDELTYS